LSLLNRRDVCKHSIERAKYSQFVCIRLVPRFLSLPWQSDLVRPKTLNLLLEEMEVERALMFDFSVSLVQVDVAPDDTSNIVAHLFDKRLTCLTMHACDRENGFHDRNVFLSLHS
jgi:hypothetical protein